MTHHHHHHHGDECCSEHECCHEESCEHHHHHAHEHHDDFAHQLLDMADEAWMELLKEKVKEQIKTSSGAQLDQLAKLVSEANHVRWKHKMGLQKDAQTYQDKLSAFFQKE